MSNQSLAAEGTRKNRTLWILARAANILLGIALCLIGLRLCTAQTIDWCSFRGMPVALTRAVGGGLVAGSALLFASRTAVIGLPLLTVWIGLWTFAPWRPLWGAGQCWPPALVLAGLFLNMVVMDLGDRGNSSRRNTELMLLYGIGAFLTALLWWHRNNR